jgi:phosphatidylinositol glycan class H protein
LTEVRDVLINEGLRRWDVRYYLAILYSPYPGEQRLEVAFQVRGCLSIHFIQDLLTTLPEYSTPFSGFNQGIPRHS